MDLIVLSDMFGFWKQSKLRRFTHKNQNYFIFSLISFMFRPDLLSICRESYAVTFQLTGISWLFEDGQQIWPKHVGNLTTNKMEYFAIVWVWVFVNIVQLYRKCIIQNLRRYMFEIGARGGAVGWGTALQARRSRVRFPYDVIGIFHWHKPSGRTMALGSTQPLTEMSTRNISWG